ncbi:MAG TPA: hypothetical protein VMV15_08975 [Candidatus Binataceae bacterium]|nr:hypothetical protein [Candidatus Binataceae bacterium]
MNRPRKAVLGGHDVIEVAVAQISPLWLDREIWAAGYIEHYSLPNFTFVLR